MASAPREQAHPSSRDVHPRHALASDPLPLLSLSLRVLKDPTCLSLSSPPYTMIPLSVGEVKSCLVVAVGRLPAWSLPPITHLPASLLACSCQGSLRKVIFQKSQYLKKSCFRLAQNTGAEGSLLPSSFFLACPRMWQQPMASSRARGLVPFVTVVSWAICSCSSQS